MRSFLTNTMTLTCGMIACATLVQSQATDIQTLYATSKGGCEQSGGQYVTISEGSVTGPGFECAISNPIPAGTGMEAYDATCTVNGTPQADLMAFDLGNNPDYFSIFVPGFDDWTDIYPCTKVPGLE